MSHYKKGSVLFKFLGFISLFFYIGISIFLSSCSSFNYVTYDRNDTLSEDPEPNYSITLNLDFQEYTSFMFIGNRIENFGTYFNTFYNAQDKFDDGYDDYEKKILSHYSDRVDSIFVTVQLSQEAIDDFNAAIEKASKIIQYHKSSSFMDKAVFLIGESYFYLGDYIKAERKFNEFISKLSMSPLLEEVNLYLAKTQLRMGNTAPALESLEKIISNSQNKSIVAEAYRSMAEYYISQRDYSSAIKDYDKSIELASDNSFKAQMQFIIATLVARSDQLKGAEEYLKVLDYNPSYDLEYLSKYDNMKYRILGGDYTNVIDDLERLQIRYKDDAVYLAQINYLKGLYYEQKKDYKNEISEYQDLIQTYPKTVPSADACYSLAKYYENVGGDYLNAFRFYKYSTEESTAEHEYYKAFERTKVLKKYFDLRSVITGVAINTDYDSAFYKFTQPKNEIDNNNNNLNNYNNPGQQQNQGDNGKNGKGGGFPMQDLLDSTKNNFGKQMIPTVKGERRFQDSLMNKNSIRNDSSKVKLSLDSVNTKNNEDSLNTQRIADSLNTQRLADSIKSALDSVKIKTNNIINAKFELADLFIYDLNLADSAEYYLNDAYNSSEDPEFKSKILFAMASLYRTENKNQKSDDTLKDLIKNYPNSSLSNEARKLLNIPVIVQDTNSAPDSIYHIGESNFANNDYTTALSAFENIIYNYSSSKYYIRSSYAAGWIYENVLLKTDSAVKCYTKILSSDPSSDISKLVAGKLNVYEQKLKEDSANLKKDSLKIDTLSLKNDSLKIDTLSLKNDSSKIKIDSNIVKSDTTKINNPDIKQNGSNSSNGTVPKNPNDNGNPDMIKEDHNNKP